MVHEIKELDKNRRMIIGGKDLDTQTAIVLAFPDFSDTDT